MSSTVVACLLISPNFVFLQCLRTLSSLRFCDQYLFKEGVVPSIHDFVLETIDEEDITYAVLSEQLVFLWVGYDLDFSNIEAQEKVREIAEIKMPDLNNA